MESRQWGTRLFALFVGVYILCFLIAESPKIFDYYRVSDDVRQQIYPLYLARDSSLFHDDLLTRYFRSHTPPFFYYAHYPFAWVIDPVVLSKLSQFALLALVLVFAYRIGKLLEGPFLGWSLVFLTVHSPGLVGLTDGGLPRGWAVPGLVVFSWAVLADRPRVALAAVVVSGLFYPPIFLVLGPSYAVWVVVRRFWSWWDALALLIIAVGFWPMVFRDPEIGRILTYGEAARMPEWQMGGRFPFIPIPSVFSLLARNFVVAYWVPGRFSPWAWALVAFGLAAFLLPARRSLISERGISRARLAAALGLPLLFSLVMYELSRLVAFRFHIPDRNVKYTIPVLGALLITLAAFRLFSLIASRVRFPLLRSSGWPALLVVCAAFLTIGTGFKANLNLWADQRFAWRLFAFVGSLPKDSLVAGPPPLMDSIPLFSRRTVYVSDEATQPLYDRYYREISQRVRRSYEAYYATDLRVIEDFSRETGADCIVVQVDDFTHRFNRARYFWEPYNAYVKSLIDERPASDFLFSHPPPRSVLYDDGHFRVVDLKAMVAAVPQFRSSAVSPHSSIR